MISYVVLHVVNYTEYEHITDIKKPIHTPEYINHLKSVATYEVYDYEESPFKDFSYEDMKNRVCLVDINAKPTRYIPAPQLEADPPANFDSRTRWPGCVNSIRNQGNCGSCWAFAVTDVLSDRFCIARKVKEAIPLSTQEMVDCDLKQLACNGGWIETSWRYLYFNGTVTQSCYPYYSGLTGARGNCRKNCLYTSEVYKKYYAQKAFGSIANIKDAKAHIVYAGPIETAMFVYSDFYQYKSGIYQPASTLFIGGHAIKILGWGVQNGVEYWICANSWGTQWGENGFFRIRMTTSGIESQLYVGFADVTRLEMTEKPNDVDYFLS